ncbi:GT4 family glycosyltransferase PelF [Hyphomicrobium sp. 2TAF46]|uniref:GT4 family glycosyltransferase PelF n=1 Tax=Hyphomicrobium sp. 2TAF46 TaxID=3233019 RepID=UPI003F909F1D
MTCLRLAEHWQSRFHQHIVAMKPDTRMLELEFNALANCVLTIGPKEPQGNLAMWRWLRRILKKNAPDALIIHIFGMPHLIAASAARSAGIKAIAVKAGNPPPLEMPDRRRWAAITLGSKLLRCPIASCSTAVDGELRKLGVGMPKHSRAIPNGIDIASLSARAARSRETKAKRPSVIGMVARLDAIKDHDTLLQALSLVHLQVPNCELWIVGEGVLHAALKNQAWSLGIAEQVKFLGNRRDVPELLGQMDVYAFSTTNAEGFGIALIEAVAAGVAVVASDVPACREVLGNGESGIIVPPGDATKLAEALVELLQNQELRANICAAAACRVQREYSIEKCAARWEALLFQDAEPFSSPVHQCAS